MLGGFIGITTIQAIIGIVLTAIPSNSDGEYAVIDRYPLACLMHRTVVRPPAIPLDVFQICVYDAKESYELAYASISLFYGGFPIILSVRSWAIS